MLLAFRGTFLAIKSTIFPYSFPPSWIGDASDGDELSACHHILSTLNGFEKSTSLDFYDEDDNEDFIIFDDEDDDDDDTGGISSRSDCENENRQQQDLQTPLPVSLYQFDAEQNQWLLPFSFF